MEKVVSFKLDAKLTLDQLGAVCVTDIKAADRVKNKLTCKLQTTFFPFFVYL
jgi:hypothetical protein